MEASDGGPGMLSPISLLFSHQPRQIRGEPLDRWPDSEKQGGYEAGSQAFTLARPRVGEL
jgi:hypothetical protein